MEAKDSAHRQALVQLEHYKKTAEEFPDLLKITELERDRCIAECNEVKNRLNELESKMKQQVVEAEEYDNSMFNHEDESDKSYQGEKESDIGDHQRGNCVDSITISIEEYNSLVQKAEKVDQISKSLVEEDTKQLITGSSENKNNEVEVLKKELEAAKVKIGMFRNRAEQAATRADAAEKANARVEDQLRKWQEQKQRRKAALAALREESRPKLFSSPTVEQLPAKNQPLGKVLDMKF
ncbi:hypothetical protein PTKIN_Ptkin05aG0174800 [Pterospermum kingtungense]